MEQVLAGLVGFIVFVFSVVVHENAHGLVAEHFGDPTARYSGRITLNPLPHIDPVGSIVLPVLAFVSKVPFIGWAKPVPINPYNFRDPKRDMMWVSLAGAGSNILLALGFAGLVRLGLMLLITLRNWHFLLKLQEHCL